MAENGDCPTTRNTRSLLVVPKKHVKRVKTALEQSDALDRATKIIPAEKALGNLDFEISLQPAKDYMVITSTLDTVSTRDPQTYNVSIDVLTSLGLEDLDDKILTCYNPILDNTPPQDRSYLRGSIRVFFSDERNLVPYPLHPDLTPALLATSFPESYSIYKPLLLLPHNAFSSPPWQTFLEQHPHHTDFWKIFWPSISINMGITCVAINSPIPASSTTTEANKENILRIPLNITPLHGSFGPLPKPQTLSHPTEQDFTQALWVSTIQNGIHQTWSPLYTMFSRGNIREKTRLLHHSSIAHAFDEPATVVDMYAGIGYFAFSYMKAGMLAGQSGIKKVICFELNPWSVEGLRRGIKKNGWTSRIFKFPSSSCEGISTDDLQSIKDELSQGVDEDFLIFQTSNEYALELISSLPPGSCPPIRHVNLGLLPTSRLSWRSAAKLIDTKKIGWIHVHENVGVKELEDRTKEVESELQRLVDEYDQERCEAGNVERKRHVKVEHLERVKMYAPGVVHCVFDVSIS